jgi:biopolymer transport protein ExbD
VFKREMPKEEPLNLVPIMNLVTILIPFLLAAIKSVELAVIDTSLPAISPGGAPPDDAPDKPPLQLKLAVTNQGVRILGAHEYLYPGQAKPENAEENGGKPDVPCKSGSRCKGVEDYNWSDLSQKLAQIKKAAQDDGRDSDSVVLISDSNIMYEVLIETMDTARKQENGDKLFPSVSIAGGTNQ